MGSGGAPPAGCRGSAPASISNGGTPLAGVPPLLPDADMLLPGRCFSPLYRAAFSAILLPVKNLLPYLFTALLALLVGLCALGAAGITPFGAGTLAWQDNGQQVASDFGYVRGVWEGRHALDWSYACGGSPRSSFHPTFNNLVSPLTWAVAALPLPALTGLSVLFLLQLALLPLGALWYLRTTFPRLPAALGMALALAYAFGGFVLSKYTFLPFLNVAILFPWWVAALDSLLRRGRWLPYTLLLAAMLAAGTYFAYMWLLFAAVYAAARTGWRWNSPVRQHTTTLFLASLAALLLAAFSWLPSLMVMAGSARAGEAHFWWNATRAEVEWGVLGYIFCLPYLLTAVLEFRRSRCNRYNLTLLVLAVGLLCVSATTLWHLSRPWDFAGRFGYMAEFMLLCIGAEAAQRKRRPFRLALAWVLVWGVLLSGVWFWVTAKAESGSYQASADRVQIAEWAAEQVPAPEGRVKSRGHAAVENLAFFTPFDTLSHFTACITKEQEETLARWGYQQRTAVISTEGGTLASDTLLGMRYILSQAGEGAPYCVEENPYYFGVGLMLPEGVFPLSAADPIARHQELLGKLLGAEHAGLRSDTPAGARPELPPDCLHYLLHVGQYTYPGTPYERWGGVEEPPALWELPPGVTPPPAATLYHLPPASLQALQRYGQELPVNCSYAGKRFTATCCSTAERPLLFLPLLWQAGYSAEVDGSSTPVQKVEGFVGIRMPAPGEHRVELHYTRRGSAAGFIVSAASLLLLLLPGAWFLTRRRPSLAPVGAGNTLCRRTMLVVAYLLLLWPLLTLPIGLLWR